MCRKNLCAVLLLCATGVCLAGNSVVPTTTLASLTANNTSAANSFPSQTNGNAPAGNVSKSDIHTLLYSGATTKVYAHLMLWFGGSDHMSVGYSSTDSKQIRRQIQDMISRGIDGVIIDWYGSNNNIDQAMKLVMSEAETHPGFTFAIMVDSGAIKWNSCSGCSPQEALISHLQYAEQTYFPSPAYMTLQGRPVVTNFDIDLLYSINWGQVNASLSSQPAFLFQNDGGFTHVLADGSYSWVMPTTSDYGMGYLNDFYNTGMGFSSQETVGASYKGFNDTLAGWGSNRVMGQQCGQTWLQTFSKIRNLYNSGKQLSALQLVTWNDYEEGTEIESGIDNCASVTASVSGDSLKWTLKGQESTIDHYAVYYSTDGKNLSFITQPSVGNRSINLCSYSIPDGSYTLYVQAIGKPSMKNQLSSGVKVNLSCKTNTGSTTGFTVGANPAAMAINSGDSGKLTVTVKPQSDSFNSAVDLTCSGLPVSLRCSFAPGSLIPRGDMVSSVLTITAVSSRAAWNGDERRRVVVAQSLFGFGLLGLVFLGKVDRRYFRSVGGVCVIATAMIATIACGGSAATSVGTGSIASSYTVTIQGRAGSIQVSTPITVTVR